MPDLSRFAVFALKAGGVPHVPQQGSAWGTATRPKIASTGEQLSKPVPHVPHVPHESDEHLTADEWQMLFDERAGILEFDGGWSRQMAEGIARREIAEMRPEANRERRGR